MAELLGVSAGTVAALLDDDGPARLAADLRTSASDQAAIIRALRDGLRAANRD
jgi:hypothetical protein